VHTSVQEVEQGVPVLTALLWQLLRHVLQPHILPVIDVCSTVSAHG
jgi:hypothetical protein